MIIDSGVFEFKKFVRKDLKPEKKSLDPMYTNNILLPNIIENSMEIQGEFDETEKINVGAIIIEWNAQ
ncbi:hypothetical protein DERP_008277 [Dermatophagoides pteronyssinus]|uniref:Uncharacterized protein n=1 Tax=Dermatophagoides pteronyssinus TaxID=6956 RepID=A0ABQ8J638_DERPT|nr:hypothetical protein DERP_008277 [Dermatophagoides pteronyssinus]